MLALVTGVVRLVVSFTYKGEGYCGEEEKGVPAILANFHYMYFAVMLTAMTTVVAVVISYFTGRPDHKYLYRTTFWTRHEKTPQPALELDVPGNDDITTSATDRAPPADITSVTIATISGSRVEDTGQQKATASFERRGRNRRGFFFLLLPVDDHKAADEASPAEQSRAEKLGLGFGLVLILGIGVFMYVFWSSYNFPAAPFYPQGAVTLLPGDEANATTAAAAAAAAASDGMG
ncbi:hypothetical protein ACOMHN_040636 [Nucella lapillus]